MHLCLCWKRKWQPTPGFLPGESHGQRSLAGCSPWVSKKLDTTEVISAHTHAATRRAFPCAFVTLRPHLLDSTVLWITQFTDFPSAISFHHPCIKFYIAIS